MEAATKDALYGDSGLVLKSKAKHAAVSAKLRRPFDFAKSEKPFIVQYEINFQSGQVGHFVLWSELMGSIKFVNVWVSEQLILVLVGL